MILTLTVIFFCVFVHGQEISKIKIEDLVKRYSNNSDTIYVINFWSTFCVPCVEEIPYLQRISKKYENKKVKLILVSLDFAKSYPVKLTEFVKQHNFTAEVVWLNETNADHFCPQVDKKWSGSIPSSLFINNKTGYKKFFEEQMKEEEFEEELKRAIVE